jgi:dihydroorotate dehydrogenase electron transfer subunit
MEHPARRGTIFLEEARVLDQKSFPQEQYVLRVAAPKCAARARPGMFAHLTCDTAIPMRRPLSIMRANGEDGWIEFLYKIVGEGMRALSRHQPGDELSLLGPIGQPFQLDVSRPRVLAIGGGVGIPPMVFLAETLRNNGAFVPLILMGSEIPFPFDLNRGNDAVDGIHPGADASLALLDSWGISSRLASKSGLVGCFEGFVTDLADAWLDAQGAADREQCQIVACGPMAMLAATAKLAARYGLPCQVALEEYMACGVGGCAGCTVEVRTPSGTAMKRVCVDGPVFDAYQVFPLA